MIPLLEINDLSFSWPGSSLSVFDQLRLTVQEGDFILVKGMSGSGKSTLLRLIVRLNEPQSGTILYRGISVTAIAPAQLRRSLCYVAQIPRMADGTIRENLLLPFTFAINASASLPDTNKLQRMLEAFYLGGLSLDQSALKLSTGQQQRLAFMRAMLLDPDLLLLDEPTSALDAESAEMVFSLMQRLSLEGKTIITVTHSDIPVENPRLLTGVLENKNLVLKK
ncbi:MAG: ATP-binding cassette domain-containing protein [Chlorobiaceae bacterium]|jgi:putative ABC transport system ATP-binding protein|nr:ATP-binding cassette domain-containing protein [Chlorobiaceae bacterium]NTW64328.1 ATP-binding cassette domain-containing protein [Chlorobiaceae bacterium]